MDPRDFLFACYMCLPLAAVTPSWQSAVYFAGSASACCHGGRGPVPPATPQGWGGGAAPAGDGVLVGLTRARSWNADTAPARLEKPAVFGMPVEALL